MTAPRLTTRHAATAFAAAALIAAGGTDTRSAEPDHRAAHELAAKFAAAADGKSPNELKDEEQEMLDRAQAEALERKAAAEKEAAEKEQAERLAEEKKKAEEQARLAAEAEAVKAKEKAEAERLAREETERKAKEDQRIAEEKKKAEEQARLAAEAEALKAKEKAEAERLAREETERKAKEDERLAAEASSKRISTNGPVTVLLIMEPGKTGIRRYGEKTADPVICAETKCWISTGANSNARMVTRGQALGPGNTLGKRAAACNHSLGCVFRGVDLSSIGLLQPIDLRVMRHDRREPQRISADTSCEATPSSLACGHVVRSATWRAWIVPEEIASKAGDKALLRALEAGLTPGRQALLTEDR